jgi:hypothetical protein
LWPLRLAISDDIRDDCAHALKTRTTMQTIPNAERMRPPGNEGYLKSNHKLPRIIVRIQDNS